MGKDQKIEQRAKVDPGFSERRGLLFRIARRHGWAVTVTGLALVALTDYLTGDRLWVGPGYLAFIGFAAWALGWREALGTVLFSALFTSQVNLDSVYPYYLPVTGWDIALRVPPVLAILALLAYARSACDTQWRLARTDPLTGALNRKAFFELAGAIRHSKSWHVLAYADLDGLKRLNDAEGHEQGDVALKAFSSHVRKAIRKDDLFARIGGDEFLVYLPVRDAQAGLIVADRLHRAMNGAAWGNAERPLRCSVGALILAPGARAIDRELRTADELMYEAKQTGAALALATAHEHGGHLTTERRYLQRRPMIERTSEAAESEFRAQPRKPRSRKLRAAA
ncbi:MAG: GGDEF domain-containing protein [Candidatus Andeanibacterium colombiense]|uniref:diguanylate cyclase n=1 Tax=Candidatus Andeanibacterium colombiense TaxID=3121345 RepID=A0AAJ5XAL1_9SPHN|nr:MAG: GGDEF domain-containing protein [Sphingomonadaceae bacterium]